MEGERDGGVLNFHVNESDFLFKTYEKFPFKVFDCKGEK
jgi:hypothetical protein